MNLHKRLATIEVLDQRERSLEARRLFTDTSGDATVTLGRTAKPRTRAVEGADGKRAIVSVGGGLLVLAASQGAAV